MRVWQTGLVITAVLLAGCSGQPPATSVGRQTSDFSISPPPAPHSDAEKVRSADISALFVGNSHTTFHDVPGLVARMIRLRHPAKTVYTHVIPVGFLEEAAERGFSDEIETREWKFVILQAQKISRSGKFNYSRKEGIDLARRARELGAAVFFFAEWGERGVAGDGARHEKIYQEMADAAEVRVAVIGRAWDMALSKRPKLPLYAADGNHESATGAYLTACVLFGCLTGESPAVLADFAYEPVSEKDRRFLAEAAASALEKFTEPQP